MQTPGDGHAGRFLVDCFSSRHARAALVDQNTAPLSSGNLFEYQLIATPPGSAGTLVTNTVSATTGANIDSDSINNSASDTDKIVTEAIFIDGSRPNDVIQG